MTLIDAVKNLGHQSNDFEIEQAISEVAERPEVPKSICATEFSPRTSSIHLWEAALNCLLNLRKFRGQCFFRPDHQVASNSIKSFCSKLRECPRWLSLPRIQRDCHLHDAAIIAICQVLASHWQMPRTPTTLQQIGVLAYGSQPPALEKFRMDVYREGPGRKIRSN